MFFAPRYVSLDPAFSEQLLELAADPGDLVLAARGQFGEAAGDRRIGLRLELAKGQKLHFAHIFIHADPLRQRGIDVHRLLGDAPPLVRILDEMQRAHIVQPVGELDEQHANIVGHGEQEFAQIFGGALILGLRLDLAELGDAVDQPPDVGAEQPLDLFGRGQRVFQRVVEQRGDDRLAVEMEVGQNARDLDRMAEIGVARGAFLAAVLLYGEDIGAVQQRLVDVGIISAHALDKFILPQHRIQCRSCDANCNIFVSVEQRSRWLRQGKKRAARCRGESVRGPSCGRRVSLRRCSVRGRRPRAACRRR